MATSASAAETGTGSQQTYVAEFTLNLKVFENTSGLNAAHDALLAAVGRFVGGVFSNSNSGRRLST